MPSPRGRVSVQSDTEARLDKLEARAVISQVQTKNFSARAGQTFVVEAPTTGLIIVLPPPNTSARNDECRFLIRNQNPVQFVCLDGTINGQDFESITKVGLRSYSCDGSLGWLTTTVTAPPLSEVLESGNTTDGHDIVVTTGDEINFNTGATGITSDGTLTISAVTQIDITAPVVRLPTGFFSLVEVAASTPSMAAGQALFWVINSTPNTPKFTDDTNTDFDIPLGSSSTSITWDAASKTFFRAALSGAIISTANSNATVFGGILDNGSAENNRTNLNFLNSTLVTTTITDDAGNDELEIVANMAAAAAKSVLANATNGSAIPAYLAGSAAFQHLRVNSANNALEWAVLAVTSPITLTSDNIGFDQTATLGNNARVAVNKNSGATVGTRRRINFIEGTNVTLTIADDSVNEEVDVTIAAAGGSGITHAVGQGLALMLG